VTPAQNVENLHRHANRHKVDLEKIMATQRTAGYNAYEAAVQLPIFRHMKHPDPEAALDGNAILVDKGAEDKFGAPVQHDILHLSAYRNCQRLEFLLHNGRRLHLVNTHLHHPIGEDHIRLH
jgi:hypothetical protein